MTHENPAGSFCTPFFYIENIANNREIRGSWPISRVLSWTVIHLGNMSPYSSSDLPGNYAGHTLFPYLVLLRVGFTMPPRVTTGAVRSYRTISPLPVSLKEKLRRYLFCCTFRRLTPPRCYLAPCPVEPGLSSLYYIYSIARLPGQLRPRVYSILPLTKTLLPLLVAGHAHRDCFSSSR